MEDETGRISFPFSFTVFYVKSIEKSRVTIMHLLFHS